MSSLNNENKKIEMYLEKKRENGELRFSTILSDPFQCLDFYF